MSERSLSAGGLGVTSEPTDRMLAVLAPNSTESATISPPLSPLPPQIDNFLAVALIICGVPGLFLNGVVTVVAMRGRKELRPLEIYIVNIAVFDLASIVFMYPLVIPALFMHYWPWGRAACIMYGFVGMFFGIITMSSLTALSVSRYLMFRSNNENTDSTSYSGVFGILAGIVVYSLVWSIVPLWGGEGYGLELHATSCSLLWRAPGAQPYLMTMLVLVLVLPAAAMIMSYMLITRHIREVQTAGGVMGQRMFKMTVLMCSTFLLAWTPYGIFAAWETFHGPEYITSPLFSALPAMFAKGVSVNNPMFHFFFNRKFRMQAVKLFTRSNRVMDTPHPPIVKPPSGSPPPIFNVDTPEMAAGELRPPNRKNHEEFSEICSSDESFLSTVHSAPTTRITTLNVKQLIPRPATISSCN